MLKFQAAILFKIFVFISLCGMNVDNDDDSRGLLSHYSSIGHLLSLPGSYGDDCRGSMMFGFLRLDSILYCSVCV